MSQEIMIAGLFGVVIVFGFAYYTANAVAILYLAHSESGVNSDHKAKSVFLALINLAEHKISIHDDGDAVQGSIYEDQDVVDAVLTRLDEHPDLRVECLFNMDSDTLFRRLLAGHDQVNVRFTDHRSIIHFKIIDNGVAGYVSRHEKGESHRPYKLHNFSRIPWYLGASSKREMAFGQHLRMMEDAFA